ncbi:MAG: hypothetical protein JXL97_16180 [Bacteroidales bacterium]|nr:hypothetical protein [Bacteroidales bacterium]
MQKTTTLILLLLLNVSIFAQQDSAKHIKTILKEKKGNTFLVAQKFQITEFAGEMSLMIGAGGGKIFNHKFLLGGGGYGTMKGVSVENKFYPSLNLEQNISHSLHFGYGGFWTGYMPNWNKTFHIVPSMFWAAGAISINRNDTEETVASNFVYILQPMIEFELNVTEFVRVAIVPEYRFVGNVNLGDYKSLDFSGFGAILFIKFGAF